MCDICKAENIDRHLRNGEKKNIYSGKLYRIFKDRLLTINLCYLHSIELFCKGEQAFLKKNIKYARSIVKLG